MKIEHNEINLLENVYSYTMRLNVTLIGARAERFRVPMRAAVAPMIRKSSPYERPSIVYWYAMIPLRRRIRHQHRNLCKLSIQFRF